GSGKYLAAASTMTFKTADAEKDALKIRLEYLPEEQAYMLWRIEKPSTKEPTMVLDVNPKGVITTGETMQYNAPSKDRTTTQQWKLSHNSDGSVTFYFTSEKGTVYALAMVEDKICIKKVTELSDDIKWTFTRDASVIVTSTATVGADGISVTASVGKVEKVNVVVTDMTGKIISTTEATVENKTATAKVALPEAKGSYLVKVLNAEDGAAAASYTFVTVA
ncbi:MAG: T9SS type A sorting domain-containing protein, partial [Clostridia bacterium]|nr:T9SS type A sorting domain-containing protein [Clostridia bacterium]